MRIRKNAKLSPLLFSSWSEDGGSLPVETHVCQLNQSPWDVIPFQYDSIQFDHNTAPNANGDSFHAVQSVASMMEKTERATVVDDNNKLVAPSGATVLNPCQGTGDKGWACKNEAKQGQSFCEQHLSLSQLATSYTSKKSQAQPSGGGTRRTKTRGAGKKAGMGAGTSSNPYEFYYYSGFGPSWGKRRGDRNGEGSKNNIVGAENSTLVEAGGGDDNVGSGEVGGSVSEMENEVGGYVDDDDDEEEEEVVEDDGGKKRMRKPVKARSLKSLMGQEGSEIDQPKRWMCFAETAVRAEAERNDVVLQGIVIK
ncbi:unnamed protein product [Sphenostylis stenocarpa]|uniref:WRC domain-containing protein n=1 Tax=Sphenostylis stenocarpa TaxID=92480 RepID=A0AA86STF3_9FABA|nr:unnamed protein product [Sphenostylis stenocarpa]